MNLRGRMILMKPYRIRVPEQAAPRDLPACGTYRGYQQHRKAGEKACRACKDARRDYMRDWRRRNGVGRFRLVPVGACCPNCGQVIAE